MSFARANEWTRNDATDVVIRQLFTSDLAQLQQTI
ncbi:Uncharacterised protein [Vibrio cholerae]|nr:Uncharacterised protein [Vibrio cholerae]